MVNFGVELHELPSSKSVRTPFHYPPFQQLSDSRVCTQNKYFPVREAEWNALLSWWPKLKFPLNFHRIWNVNLIHCTDCESSKQTPAEQLQHKYCTAVFLLSFTQLAKHMYFPANAPCVNTLFYGCLCFSFVHQVGLIVIIIVISQVRGSGGPWWMDGLLPCK